MMITVVEVWVIPGETVSVIEDCTGAQLNSMKAIKELINIFIVIAL
jgi:hypothetical protein